MGSRSLREIKERRMGENEIVSILTDCYGRSNVRGLFTGAFLPLLPSPKFEQCSSGSCDTHIRTVAVHAYQSSDEKQIVGENPVSD